MGEITTQLDAVDTVMRVGCKMRGLAAIASIGEVGHAGLEGLDVLFSSFADQLENAAEVMNVKKLSAEVSNQMEN